MPRKRDHRKLKRIVIRTDRGEIGREVDATGRLVNWHPGRGMAEIAKAPLPAPPPRIPTIPVPSSDAVHLSDPRPLLDFDLVPLSDVFENIHFDTFDLPATSADPDIGGMPRVSVWDNNLFDLPWDHENTVRNGAPDQEPDPLRSSH
jgi:hypothetical protein